MGKVGRLVWNMARLGLGVAVAAMLLAALIYAFRGQWSAAVGMVTLMVSGFFAINVANFVQYRWAEAPAGTKTMVIFPLVGAASAVGLSLVSSVGALALTGVVVVYWLATTRRRPDLASSRVPARLLIDDEGVRRMYANMELDRIGWEELVEVKVSPTANRQVVREDEFYFFLIDPEGNICLVPNGYAMDLLPRLQQLTGFDNEGLVEVATGASEGAKTLWRGRAGSARRCARMKG